MKSREFWVKFACWVGVVVDAVAALMLMFPEFNTWMTGEPLAVDSIAFRNANATATALMWGWTVLLAWAALNPKERYGVAIITLVPVLSWLTVSRIYNLINGLVDPSRNIPILILQISIFVLMAISLWNFRHKKEKEQFS